MAVDNSTGAGHDIRELMIYQVPENYLNRPPAATEFAKNDLAT
jgi:hypothetical protein